MMKKFVMVMIVVILGLSFAGCCGWPGYYGAYPYWGYPHYSPPPVYRGPHYNYPQHHRPYHR